MHLRFFPIMIFLTGAALTSCSVYKSSGRKSFESKSSGNLTSGVATENSAAANNDSQTCWNQPVDDPLWHIDAESSLVVTPVSDDEIKVCQLPP